MAKAMTRQEMLAQIQALQAENARLEEAAKPKPKALSLKVSQKGAASLYGLGRFPVTLYASQWERLIQAAPAISQFLTDNADTLVRKD